MSNSVAPSRTTWIFFILALIAYISPWVLNSSSGLSVGAYDLAELLSKQPFNQTIYTTIFFLRLQLFLITCYLAFSTSNYQWTFYWWILVIVCIGLIITQLPPLTFIVDTDDVNQQQQAVLAGISFLGAIVGLSGYFYQQKKIILIIITILGIATSLYAIIQSLRILNAYEGGIIIGFGSFMLIALYGGMLVRELRNKHVTESLSQRL